MLRKKTKIEISPHRLYLLRPWECHHYKDHSELMAYIEASGNREIIALIKPTAGASAEQLACFIVTVINENRKNRNLLQSAVDTLELVLNDGLTFSSEQAAEKAIANIRQVV